MRRFFAFLIALAIISGSFGPALADRPGGDSPCMSATLEQIQEEGVSHSDSGVETSPFLRQAENLERCVAIDTAVFVLPTAEQGSCGLKAIAAQSLCHAYEPRIISVAVSGAEHALLPAFLAQPERPPKNG